MERPLRTVIADDSRFSRTIIRDALTRIDAAEVVAEASTGTEALKAIRSTKPDLVLLDFHMPEKDGLEVLKQMRRSGVNIPVIMSGKKSESAAEKSIDALLSGAYDCIQKPSKPTRGECVLDLTRQLSPRLQSLVDQVRSDPEPARGLTALFQRTFSGAISSAIPTFDADEWSTDREVTGLPLKLAVIGAGTGGPAALLAILSELSEDFPLPILVIQHLQKEFTAPLVQRLQQECDLKICVAEHGMEVVPGTVFVAPGGSQMGVDFENESMKLGLFDDPPEHGNRPSIDYTLRSIGEEIPEGVLIAILTGIGRDGTSSSRSLARSGSVVFAQHPEGCTVYGMPRAVIEEKIADRILTLDDFAYAFQFVAKGRSQ